MVKISVLMPVFNGSEYLERSISSVINQSMSDWQLVVLDDGSSDESYTMLRKMADADKRITLIHKENDGHGCTALNLSIMLPQAKGEYCFYMSQDDRIDNDLFETAMKHAEEHCLDIIVPDMLLEYADETECPTRGSYPPDEDYSTILSGREAFFRSIDFSINGFAFIRRRLMENEQQDTTHFDSDELNTRLQFLAADRVGFCRSTFHYYQGNPKAITKKFSPRWFERLATAVILDKACQKAFSKGTDKTLNYKQKLKGKTWTMSVYASLTIELLKHSDSLSVNEKVKAKSIFKYFERNIQFKGYVTGMLRSMTNAEKLLFLWYLLFGTCRNMTAPYRFYKFIKRHT